MSRNITGNQLRTELKSIGWSQKVLSERLDVGQDTVSHWITGKSPVPVYASEYLRVVQVIRSAARDI